VITLKQISDLQKVGGSLVCEALLFAENKHRGQYRKYEVDGKLEDYINHPIRVANRLLAWGITDPVILAAALLHDVLEDTDATLYDLYDLFGPSVAIIVLQLTEQRPPGANRKARKAIYGAQIALGCEGTQLSKLGDIDDNIAEFGLMMFHDPKFAKLYLGEIEDELAAMEPNLHRRAISPFTEVKGLVRQCREMHL